MNRAFWHGALGGALGGTAILLSVVAGLGLSGRLPAVWQAIVAPETCAITSDPTREDVELMRKTRLRNPDGPTPS